MFTILLYKLPPKVFSRLYYFVLTLKTIYNAITDKILGLLFLTLTIYFCLLMTRNNRPLLPSELFLFVDNLSKDYKIAIFSSLITILGFIVAFHTATINWKQQTIVSMKISTAQEVEAFFAEALKLISDVSIYSKMALDAIAAAKKDPSSPDTIFRVQYVLKENAKFDKAIERLSALSVEVFRFQSKHFQNFYGTSDSAALMQQATSCLTKITNEMWIVIPELNITDPNMVSNFLKFTDENKVANFFKVCEENQLLIWTAEGGLRGVLLAPLMEPTFTGLWDLIKNRRQFEIALAKLHEEHKSRKKPKS